jgi:hypothetical protein
MEDNPYSAPQVHERARERRPWISDRNAMPLALLLSFGLLFALFAGGAIAILWAAG